MWINRRFKGSAGAATVAAALAVLMTPTAHAQADVTVQPTVVDFPVTELGTSSTETVRIRNDGSDATTITVSTDGNVFEVTGSTCGGNLGGGESCSVDIEFTPDDVDTTYDGQLDVRGTDTASISFDVEVPLFGDSTPDASETTTTPPITTPPSTTPPTTGATTTSSVASETTIGTGPATSTGPPTTDLSNTSIEVSPTSSSVPSVDPDVVSEAEMKRLLADCEERARNVEVGFPTDLQMTLGTATDVTVRAAIAGTPPVSTAGDEPPSTVAEATLSCFVVASLSGQSFAVDPGGQTGDFLTTPTIEWTWSVEAQAAGKHLLRLRIVPRLQTPVGFEEGSPVGPFDATIEVTTLPRSTLDRWGDGAQRLVNHPLTRSLGPAVGLLGTLAGVWRWILQKPWPWTRRALGSDASDPDPEEERSGYL